MKKRALTVVAVASGLVVSACDQMVTRPSRYAAVEVRTTRRDGSPVSAVPLVLSTGLRVMGYDTTDVNGRARFDRIPEGPAYGVLAGEPVGYARMEALFGGAVSDFVSFDLHRDSLPAVRFQFLKIGPGTIAAKVVDQASTPLSGVDVEVYSSTKTIDRQKTTVDGRATFSAVPFGGYGVRAYRPEAYRDAGEPLTLDVDGLVVDEGVTETRTLVLQRCAGAITLTVSHPVFGAGANIRTQLFRATGVVDTKRTGADGAVQYTGIDCIGYGVRLLPSADWVVIPGRGTEFLDGLIVHRGTVHNVSLPGQYNTCRGSVRVTAADRLGTAVPGVTVTISTSYDDPVVTQITSSTGIAIFDALGCGPERTVNITAPPGWTATPGRGGTYLDGLLVTNEGTVSVAFTLTRAGT